MKAAGDGSSPAAIASMHCYGNAESMLVLMYRKIPSISLWIVLNAPTMTIETRPAIKPYSMAVAPT
jgi:hypothetical protein